MEGENNTLDLGHNDLQADIYLWCSSMQLVTSVWILREGWAAVIILQDMGDISVGSIVGFSSQRGQTEGFSKSKSISNRKTIFFFNKKSPKYKNNYFK